tara:strand:- start:21748 stop:23082 length:1335 start_codon:yes stop_codon:yes gene_type:complete
MKLDLKNLKSLIKEAVEEHKKTMLLEEPQPLEEIALRNNPNPFKAIFIFGPAGAGKSFISGKLGIPEEFVTSNPDEDIEAQFGNFGVGLKFADKTDLDNWKQQQAFREKLQNASQAKTANWLNTATPVIFDTTGEDVMKMGVRAEELNEAGYDVAVFQINVPPEVSIQRDKDRARTVGAPTATISKQYQDEVQDDRGYFQLFDGYRNIKILGGDIYANIYDLRDDSLLVPKELADEMKTKDGKPYTPEYAKQVLAKATKDLTDFLDGSTREPKNKNGKILYRGMMALLDKSGDKLGNRLTDFIVAAHDPELLQDPAIVAAGEKIAELGGAREMFAKAQRSQKVAGYKQGQARSGEDGKLRDPTAGELDTKRSKIPFEVWRKMVANDIKGRDDLSDDEKKKRIEKLANMKKGDRYTDGPKLTAEEAKLHDQVKEIIREILLTKEE